MALLALEGLVAGYVEGIDILNGLTLGVERGTVTGIIRPNGAGKSTLLKTIFGFLHPRSGQIVFDGHDVGAVPPHALKRLGIGYVPQGANVFPQLTVQENLQIGTWVFRHDRARVAGGLCPPPPPLPPPPGKSPPPAPRVSGRAAEMVSVAQEPVDRAGRALVGAAPG